jgi:hypothetical protein
MIFHISRVMVGISDDLPIAKDDRHPRPGIFLEHPAKIIDACLVEGDRLCDEVYLVGQVFLEIIDVIVPDCGSDINFDKRYRQEKHTGIHKKDSPEDPFSHASAST